MVIEDLKPVLASSKTFPGVMQSFAARGAENLWEIRPHELKTAITL